MPRRQASTHPAMISTIPRSGTWRSIYFFYVYRELVRGNPSPDVVKLHPQATRRGDKDYMRELGVIPLVVDHYPCPGFNKLHGPVLREWTALTKSLGSYAFSQKLMHHYRMLAPQKNPAARICFIPRNPLDVWISAAKMKPKEFPKEEPPKLREKIFGKPKRRINPQWPATDGKQPEPGQSPFDACITNFQHTRVMEIYASFLMTFIAMQKEFPQNIIIVPYEATENDAFEAYRTITAHFGLDKPAGSKFEEYVRRAIDITSYERMKEYESRLGQSLSAPPLEKAKRMEEWQPVKTHLPVMKHKPWQELFGKEDFRHILDVLGRYQLTPEMIGANFARDLRKLAA